MAFVVVLVDPLGAQYGVPLALPAVAPQNPEARAIHDAFVAMDTDRTGTIEWRELQVSLNAAFAPVRFTGHLTRFILRAFSARSQSCLQSASQNRRPSSTGSAHE
jgi:hypothetical protein